MALRTCPECHTFFSCKPSIPKVFCSLKCWRAWQQARKIPGPKRPGVSSGAKRGPQSYY